MRKKRNFAKISQVSAEWQSFLQFHTKEQLIIVFLLPLIDNYTCAVIGPIIMRCFYYRAQDVCRHCSACEKMPRATKSDRGFGDDPQRLSRQRSVQKIQHPPKHPTRQSKQPIQEGHSRTRHCFEHHGRVENLSVDFAICSSRFPYEHTDRPSRRSNIRQESWKV